MKSTQQYLMQKSIALAEAAMLKDEVPVGAIIVDSRNNKIISKAYNQVINGCNPTAHAEILAIQKACKRLKNNRLEFCDMFVTLEPCIMCAGAISFARIRRLYFAAYDHKSGAVESGVRFFYTQTCHHAPEIYGGILEEDSASLLRNYFKSKRL